MTTGTKKIGFKFTPMRLALAAVAAVGFLLILIRLIMGIGAVTNLNDQWPWGFWIAFDDLVGVALAAGGYIVALMVYIMRRDKFYSIARSAMLTSLLGYVIVAIGLLVDSGQWYNFWKPLVSWGYGSAMFAVFWCLFVYLIIQMLEFGGNVLIKRNSALYRFFNKAMPVFLVLGVVLALLHQSTLGAIYYLMAGKLDVLWWSSMLPVFFLISSFFVGIAMIVIESNLAEKAVGHKVETTIFNRLIKISAFALVIYLILKFVDLGIAGELGNAFAFNFTGNMFLLEIVAGVIIPIIIAFTPAIRTKGGILTFSLLVVAGVLLNRFNVVFTGMADYLNAGGGSYFPSWQEFVISLGLVAFVCIAYLFIAENFDYLSHDKERKSIESGRA